MAMGPEFGARVVWANNIGAIIHADSKKKKKKVL
jgi:hypothetical protein